MPTRTYDEDQFDWAISPGEILQQELEARELPQSQLAARAGLSAKHVNLVIKGNAPISAEVAVSLEEILGVSAESWLRAEAAFQAAEARKERKLKLAGYKDWVQQFPIAELVARGVVERADDISTVAEKLLRFFGVVSPAAFEKACVEPQASFKRSQLLTISAPHTALWIRLAEIAAEEKAQSVKPYDAEKLRELVPQIVALTREDFADGFKEAQSLLLKAGVVLVFVPEVDQTRISGLSKWADKNPLIAMTGRYKYFDSFWFSLVHEIGHVLLHPKRATFLELENKANDNLDQLETAANDFAALAFIPKSKRKALADAASLAALNAFAEDVGIGAFMAAGQRAHLLNEWGGINGKMRVRGDINDLLAS